MLDDAAISGWCARSLGAPMTRALFRTGHLAQVVGAELADGRHAVIKIRPHEPRIAGCAAVQTHLGAAGFPPAPPPWPDPPRKAGTPSPPRRTSPAALSYHPATGPRRSRPCSPGSSRWRPPVASIPALTPSPPWAAWDHPGSRLWPDRDDQGRNLNHTHGPAWVDTAAAQVRQRLRTFPEPFRAGHGDWESQNIRWADG